MRLRLKIVYLYLFFRLKKKKKGYYGNESFIFAWNLGVIFLGTPNWVITKLFLQNYWFLQNFFDFEGFIEKCVGCFVVYLFYGGWRGRENNY